LIGDSGVGKSSLLLRFAVRFFGLSSFGTRSCGCFVVNRCEIGRKLRVF
jgi:hypothetical protein